MRVQAALIPALTCLLAGGSTLAEDLDFKKGRLGRLAPLIGTVAYEKVLNDPDVARALAAQLPPPALKALRANLTVRTPIDFESGFLVLTGNAPHAGGEEMAGVWVNIGDATTYVALTERSRTTLYAKSPQYGYLPRGLRAYVRSPTNPDEAQPPSNVVWRR